MGLIIGELTEIPLERFIEQINFMLKDDKFPDDYPREVMYQFLVLAQGLLGLKSTILLGFNAFREFEFNK